jgi:hypothetical protein
VLITVVASPDGHCLYTAVSTAGVVLVERSRTPLLDGARALLSMSSATSSHPLAMCHTGSTAIALTATTVGYAAGLEVVESGHGPIFRPHRPLQEAHTANIPSCG